MSNDDIEQVLGKVNGRESSARVRVLRNNGIKSRHYAIDPTTGQPTHNNAQLTAEAIRLCTFRPGSRPTAASPRQPMRP